MLPLIGLLFQILAGGLLPAILVVVAVFVVVLIIFLLGRLILGIIVNSILGLLAIWVVDTFFGLGIPFTIPVVVVTAIFGLPAVLVLIILRLFGISI